MSDRQTFNSRIKMAITRIDDLLIRLTAGQDDERIKQLQQARHGLTNAQKTVQDALDGLRDYGDTKEITAKLDENNDCIGYEEPGSIKKYFENIRAAIKLLHEAGAFTMSSELVPVNGMALWSKMHQNKATELAASMNLTTLEGSLGGSLFDQCSWGTKWQNIQGDPLVAQWKDLSVIAADMAIKKGVAHVLLLEDAHPRSAFTTQELPHLIAHGGITIDNANLKSIELHRYGLAADPRARDILVKSPDEFKILGPATKDQYIVVVGETAEKTKIYFHENSKNPTELELPKTKAANKQLTKLFEAINKLRDEPNDVSAQRNLKAMVHGFISKKQLMTPELQFISTTTVATTAVDSVNKNMSLDERKANFAQRAKNAAKLDPQGKIHEAYDVMQERIQKRQEARSKFRKIASTFHGKVLEETAIEATMKTSTAGEKQEEHKTKVEEGAIKSFSAKTTEAERFAVARARAMRKELETLKSTATRSLQNYDVKESDRTRVIWQKFPPTKIVQQKTIVITPIQNDDNNFKIYYMHGNTMESKTILKTEFSKLVHELDCRLTKDKETNDYRVYYDRDSAKKLQNGLDLGKVQHEDLQLEISRASDEYKIGTKGRN